jgi:hypothetical protein
MFSSRTVQRRGGARGVLVHLEGVGWPAARENLQVAISYVLGYVDNIRSSSEHQVLSIDKAFDMRSRSVESPGVHARDLQKERTFNTCVRQQRQEAVVEIKGERQK